MAKPITAKICAAALFFLMTTMFTACLTRKYSSIPLNNNMKGVWIATVENIDYPSKPGISVSEQKKEYRALLDSFKKAGINTVFMQVRPTADTFWESNLDPWSAYLTGRQGRRPGSYFYDPLKFMVDETHKRGMSFHAWLNPYRVQNNDKYPLSDKNYASLHPEIVVDYGGKKYYNPARQEAITHNDEIITELLTKYNIDGIHFDDYFYPYPVQKNKQDVDFPDDAEYSEYLRTGGTLSRDDWRRENVNKLIEQLHKTIKKLRPNAIFGISPFGIWRNKSDDVPDGSPTKAFQSYDKLYADTRTWIKNGWIDYVMPQLYWNYGHKTAPFGELLKWWEQETLNYGNHGNEKTKLYIGLALYKHGDKAKGWPSDEIEKQLKDIEGRENVHGAVFFSAKYLLKNKNREIEIVKDFYKNKKTGTENGK